MHIIAFLLTLLTAWVAHAQTIPVPALSARAWILMDYATGQVLAASDPDAKLEPASLTKIMTTYLVAEALKQKTLSLQQPIVVSERAWRTLSRRLAKYQLARHDWEGPQDYARRVGTALPAHAAEINTIARLYAVLRYGNAPINTLDELRRRIAAFRL